MALVNKYYGHPNHRLHFAVSELKKWNVDVISGERKDLVDNYIQEEIKVEFILDCLFAESKNQRSTEAHDIMAKSVLEFISKISGQRDLYTTPVFRDRLGWIQSQTTAFSEFTWVFRDKRHKDCLSVAQDVLFQRMLPGATGVPPPGTRDCIKRMIVILECGTPALKDRWWPGHHSIPPRVFGPSQYLMTPLVQLTKPKSTWKPKLTSKPLPANLTLKLVPPETQSDAEEC